MSVTLDKAMKVKCSSMKDFYYNWMHMLRFKHNLTKRQMQLAAEFLNLRHELSDVIKDESVLEDITTSLESKKECRKRLNIKEDLFNVMWRRLKMSGFIVDGKINALYIPNITANNYKLGLIFLIEDNVSATTKQRTAENKGEQ